MEDVAGSPVVGRGGTRGEQVSLHLAVFGFVVDRAGQNRSQGVVVVVADADTHIDPEKDSAGEGGVLVVGREEEAPASSFDPYPGSTCPDLD